MPFEKDSQLPPATPLTGSEIFRVVQDGFSRRSTIAAVSVGALLPIVNTPFLVLAADGTLTSERVFTVGAGLTAVDGGPGGSYLLSLSSAIPTGLANPTASVSLAAVNGVATTAMRSDAAPALDVGISPTWTGNHTFNNSVVGGSFRPTGSAIPAAGLYLPSADTVGLATNSILRVSISPTGNVTINAASSGVELTVTGEVVATSFSGDGSALTAISASNISSGTLADARLSGNVALLNAAPANFSGGLRVTGATAPASGSSLEVGWDGANAFLQAFNRTGLVYLPLRLLGLTVDAYTNGTSRFLISSGGAVTWPNNGGFTLPAGATLDGATIWTSANDGAGSGLDADLLDGQSSAFYQSASNINAGTLADARLTANVPLLSALNTFSETQNISAGVGVGARWRLAGNGATPGTNSFDLIQDSDSNAYVWNRRASTLLLGTSGTSRMEITSGGTITFPNNGGFTLPAGATLNGTTILVEGGVGSQRVAAKTSTTSRSSTTTVSADPALQITGLSAGEYAFELLINWRQNGGASQGIRFTFGGTNFVERAGKQAITKLTAETTSFGTYSGRFGTNAAEFAYNYGASATDAGLLVHGSCNISSAGGTIEFRWAQETSNASATEVQSGYLTVTRLS